MGKNNKPIDAKTAIAIMLKSGFKPLEPYKNSKAKWKCKCIRCKKISYPMLKHVKFYGTKCRYCVGTLVDEKDAIQVMKKNKFVPLVTYPGGNRPWKSQCKVCKEISSPSYSHVVQRGHCCKFCAPNADVSSEKAIIAFRARGFEVIGNYINTKTAVQVKCVVCKKLVKKKYDALMQGTGCSICARNQGLDKSEAIKYFRDHGFEPQEEFTNVNTPWKSKCTKCNKVSQPTYGNVRSGKGCSYCSGNKVDPKDAVKNMINWGYKPLEAYKSSQSYWKCLHIPCGSTVSPLYAQIQQGYGGCMKCAPFGISMESPSYLYLITNEKFNSHKVGIGNFKKKSDRLKRFNKMGWQTHRVWKFETGEEALAVEKSVFKILRKDLKLPIHLSKEEMPKTEGHTETVDAELITLREIEAIIKRVIKGYRK